MNFTLYITNQDEVNIWLSEDNRIRVLAPLKYLVPPRQEWEVRLNDLVTLENPSPPSDIQWFDTMMQVILFLLDYCDGDIHFTYRRINGTDTSGIEKMETTWSKKDFSQRTLPRTDISKRKLLLP